MIYLVANPEFRLAPKAGGVGDVWRIRQDRNNTHPASFPVDLARRAIAATPARVVLDPFMGSGTTAVAALQEGRDYIGLEISDEYCRYAGQRIAEATGSAEPDAPSALDVRAALATPVASRR